jgi:hypothetical protein
MKRWSRSVTGYLSNGLASAAFLLIAIASLAGGCDRPASKNDGGDTTASPVVSKLSPSLAGKRITVRGKLFMFKCGQGIGLDSGQAICMVGMPPKSDFGDPYAAMNDKPPLEVTGTLRLFHDSNDHYFFQYETTQVRIMTEYKDRTAVSSGGSQLSQALVGKRITIHGRLEGFKCGSSVELEDGEFVCLIDVHPKAIDMPYPGMFDKPVEATGTLRFFHNTTPVDETGFSQ